MQTEKFQVKKNQMMSLNVAKNTVQHSFYRDSYAWKWDSYWFPVSLTRFARSWKRKTNTRPIFLHTLRGNSVEIVFFRTVIFTSVRKSDECWVFLFRTSFSEWVEKEKHHESILRGHVCIYNSAEHIFLQRSLFEVIFVVFSQCHIN